MYVTNKFRKFDMIRRI